MSKLENAFQSKVIKDLRKLGCIVIKNKADVSTGKGIPDLTVFVGNYRAYLVELKTDTGKLSSEQEEIIEFVMKNKIAEVFVISPKNYQHFKDLIIQIRNKNSVN